MGPEAPRGRHRRLRSLAVSGPLEVMDDALLLWTDSRQSSSVTDSQVFSATEQGGVHPAEVVVADSVNKLVN